jgi:hypothetical protein
LELVKIVITLNPAGLPDGWFSKQKSNFGLILEGLAMEDDGIFYGHLVHFTVLCYILWTFGIVSGNLVYFSRFGILYREKSGNPGPQAQTLHTTCGPELRPHLHRNEEMFGTL